MQVCRYVEEDSRDLNRKDCISAVPARTRGNWLEMNVFSLPQALERAGELEGW